MKVSIIDWIIKKLKRCIAIVEEGNTASQAIGSGKYVMWKGNLYTADTAISSGTTLAASGGSKNLTAVADGGYNDLNGKISTLNSNKASAPSNTIIRYGQVTVDAGTDRKAFSFGHTFSSAPRILLTPINDGNGGVVFTSFDIQTTQATALLRTGSLSYNQHIDWIAIGS